MVVIVCLDEQNGMLFNDRRLSRDSVLIEDAIRYAAGSVIWVDSYSAELFSAVPDAVNVCDTPLRMVPDDGICFVEKGNLTAEKDRIHSVVIYRWNRRYPSDVKFPIEFFEHRWMLQSSFDFSGTSHDRLTREIYVL